MKKVILILVLTMSFANFSNASTTVIDNNDNLEIGLANDINCELLSLMEEGKITSISVVKNGLDSCTLSAEVSYNGAAIKLSITAEDCYKAGAGLAQAVKGFYSEVKK